MSIGSKGMHKDDIDEVTDTWDYHSSNQAKIFFVLPSRGIKSIILELRIVKRNDGLDVT
jgi:hypothetical protein